jgi:hypothetical protein
VELIKERRGTTIIRRIAAGASIWKPSEVSRHKSLDTFRGYVRRADLFREHAAAAFETTASIPRVRRGG